MPTGPLDLSANAFLSLYAVLLALTIVSGFVIPRWLRPEGRGRVVSDPDQLAMLAGGEQRFAETTVARLLTGRALTIVGDDRFHVDRREAGRTAAERGVLTLAAPIGWSDLARVTKGHAEPIERELVGAELMIDRGVTRQLRWWQTAPYLVLLLFGAIRLEAGMARERPVGFLVALMVLTGVLALFRWMAVDRCTRAGQEALVAMRERADRIRRAPTPGETDLAVALFGTAVLAGSAWSAFHTMRSATSGDGGSSSSDSGGGCGGGGCGGGGCGG